MRNGQVLVSTALLRNRRGDPPAMGRRRHIVSLQSKPHKLCSDRSKDIKTNLEKDNMVLQSRLYNVLPDGYGYVLLVGTGSVFVNTWMAINVGRARRKYGVEYPKMYSDDSNEFNCIQRAHQNTLENHPTFLFFLLTGGLQYPKCSAVAGLVYVLGRIVYAKGYYSGDPKNKRWGGFGHLGLLVLMGGTISFATYLLGLIGEPPDCGPRFIDN
ncbi:hypothetical protein LSH36_214g03052 [Paralvinella palmiformis]|uniref:Glutathione S-transferase 3, mitochondrial n=1 Tax=Paralvinella palmiformis TaxID=53620 RepID=A0AAD9N639_9ANNE|nr:hypothetical protein LSH36_214g03052 [Paralvinella palmiformis]